MLYYLLILILILLLLDQVFFFLKAKTKILKLDKYKLTKIFKIQWYVHQGVTLLIVVLALIHTFLIYENDKKIIIMFLAALLDGIITILWLGETPLLRLGKNIQLVLFVLSFIIKLLNVFIIVGVQNTLDAAGKVNTYYSQTKLT